MADDMSIHLDAELMADKLDGFEHYSIQKSNTKTTKGTVLKDHPFGMHRKQSKCFEANH